MNARTLSFAAAAAFAIPVHAQTMLHWNISAFGLEEEVVWHDDRVPPTSRLVDEEGSFLGIDNDGDGDIEGFELKRFVWDGIVYWPYFSDGQPRPEPDFLYSTDTGLRASLALDNTGRPLTIDFGRAHGGANPYVSVRTYWRPSTLTVFEGPFPVVPEPSTWLMALGGLAALGAMTRARRKASKA